MSDTWKDPARSTENRNPYADWWYQANEALDSELFTEVPFVRATWGDDPDFSIMQDQGARMALEEFGGTSVPIPKQAKGKPVQCLKGWYTGDFPGALPENLPDDDLVIVGIIDTGIALGHRRFRCKNGSTRFLAAWQQTSEYKPGQELPCGQELYAQDIDCLLYRNSGNSLDGRLDEDAFNRAAHLVEPWHELGHRDLEYRAAHGTHVLDLAAGFDPDSPDADKYRIIAVNLPPQYIHGSAGNFLVFFAVFALERILCLADALWRTRRPKQRGGYPVVVNFSYGMQAGPKDGGSPWENAIRRLIDRRMQKTGAPTRLVMPVGNDNLGRGAAVALMGTGRWRSPKGRCLELTPEIRLPWRIKPSDQTSNFVEIWGTIIGTPSIPPTQDDFRVFVTPPGRSPLLVPRLSPGHHADLGDYARVYCPRPQTGYPLRLVVCVAPTLRYGDGLVTAPAGDWEIMVRYEKTDPVDVAFLVQSDQSGTRHSKTGEQSYFDHSAYKTYREDGRLRDSYDYETKRHEEPWNEQGPVQRKGTHNALASNRGLTVVGGYRLTDGRPTLYSATTNGERWRDKGRQVIDGLYPTEDGPAHFGLLGAGSRDGSMVAFRGTSMAAALATRDIAAELVGCRTAGSTAATDCGSSAWIRKKAKAYKAPGGERPKYYRGVKGLKGGPGHLPMPEGLAKGRVSRFGER